jgi:hypothetical protein
MEKLLKVLARIEAEFGDVGDDILARRYEDGLNALKSEIDAEQHLAAVRLEQWIKSKV